MNLLLLGLLSMVLMGAAGYLFWRLKLKEKEIAMEREASTRQVYELSILKELGERVGYSLDVEEILQIITNSLHQFIDYTAVAYLVVKDKKLRLGMHFDKSAHHHFFLEMKEKMLASLGALSNISYDKFTVEEIISGAVEMETGPEKIGSFFNIPLVIGGKLTGVLTVANDQPGLYKEGDMTILYKITGQVSEAFVRLQKVVASEQEKIEKVREEYTSMIVHELRSPLDGIRKIIELVIGGKVVAGSKEFEEYINMAYQSTSWTLELVNDLLDLSKLQAGKFEIVKADTNIKEVIENRISFYQVAAGAKKIHVDFVPNDLPTSVLCDERAVKQILNNFLSNAIKFTGEGGVISVVAFVTGGKDAPTSPLPMPVGFVLPTPADLKMKKRSLCVTVCDNGVGINQDMLPKLFQTYKQIRLSSATGGERGTGLGLAIAKGITEAHGGSIGAVSKEGKGSSFFFTIPL